MPSKGVQCYSYIAVPGCEVEFSVPGTNLVRNQLKVFYNDYLEVDKKNIKGLFNFSRAFSFKVTQNGNQITVQDVTINTVTGDNKSGSIKTIGNQALVVTNDVIVTYSFYNAGPGIAGLLSSDQRWVTVTPNYSD
jgi:hypothetical protein